MSNSSENISLLEAADRYTEPLYCTVNSVTIIINVIHIILLYLVPGFRQRVYFWILVYISIPDIALSIIMIAIALYSGGQFYVLSVIYIIMQTCTLSRYCVLTLASLERYYAVCVPFKYSTNILVNNVGKSTIITWVYSFFFSSMHFFVIAGIFQQIVAQQVFFISLVPPTVATIVFLTKVWKELQRMKAASTNGLSQEDASLRNASRYVIFTGVLFYSILVPFLIYNTTSVLTKVPPEIHAPLFSTLISFQSLYGVLNVVLYAFMNPSYLTPIRTLCGRFPNKVTEEKGGKGKRQLQSERAVSAPEEGQPQKDVTVVNSTEGGQHQSVDTVVIEG